MVSVILIVVSLGAAFALAVRAWSSSLRRSKTTRPIPGPSGQYCTNTQVQLCLRFHEHIPQIFRINELTTGKGFQ